LQAVLPQPAFVDVLVTSDACGGNAEVRAGQILILDVRFFRRSNAVRRMAFVAGRANVLSFQRPSRLLVIEIIYVPFDVGDLDELDQLEVHPVMVRVAADASLAGSRLQAIAAMQAALGRHAGGDFGVAFQALELRLSTAELVAVSAMRRAV